MPLIAIAVLVLLSAGSLLYLRQYFAPLPVGYTAEQKGFGAPDVALGLLITLVFGSSVLNMGKEHIITIRVILANFVVYVSVVILIFGFLLGRKRNPARLFGLWWPGWQRGLPASLLCLVAAYPILLLVQGLVLLAFGAAAKEQEILQFLASNHDLQARVMVIVMAVILAPISEEVIFRGYLYGIARQYLGRWTGLLLVSFIFALVHAHLPSLPGLFLFGIFLGLTYEKTGSLWASMAVHATFNAITVICTLLWPQMAQ